MASQETRVGPCEPIQLTSNYFKIHAEENWTLFRYSIKFKPEEDRSEQRKALLNLHREKIGNFLLDGGFLYAAKKLAEEGEPLLIPQKPKNGDYQMIIDYLGDMKPGDPRYFHMYHSLTKKIMEGMDFETIGRNYYDVNATVPVTEYGLVVFPGYVTNIQHHGESPFLCVDVTHKVMGQASMYDELERMIEEHGSDYKEVFTNEMVGLTVWTKYDNKLQRIDEVDFSLSPLSKIKTDGGFLDLTYKEFYKINYGINIYHSAQPLLVVNTMPWGRREGKMEKGYLIPELCGIAGLMNTLRNDAPLKTLLSTETHLPPAARVEKIHQFSERLLKNTMLKKELSSWNMQVDADMLEVTGKILPPEKLIFGDDCLVDVGPDGDWAIAFRENNLFKPAELENWVVVTPEVYSFEARKFVTEMMKSTRNFHLSDPRWIEIEDPTPESYSSHMEQAIIDFNPQLMMVVVQGRRPEIFTRVMKKCYVENAVPCQVITDKCFSSEEVEPIATKVAIQLNCKIGGSPWSIHIPVSGLMVVGIDVYQDTVKRNINYGAVVASLDRNLTRHCSMVHYHQSNEQLTNNIITSISRALDKYREINEGNLPSKIMIYRDGVSDNQVTNVSEHEVCKVHGAIRRVYGQNAQVHLAYILVSTRTHTRLFHGHKNPPPGTVVEGTLTNPLRKDFYLVSQSSGEDSAVPTYYNVVFDSLRLNLERIQILTFKLTHMYFNNSTNARTPAQLGYARKLAYLVSQSIHNRPSAGLEDLLYYL